MKAVRDARRSDPPAHGLGDELRAVVGADPGRNAAQDEQVGQDVDDVDRGELAPDPDGQALAGELVQDIEHAEGPAVICPVMDEVVGPDMVRPIGAQPDAGAVVEPQTPSLGLFLGHLQPLAPPQAQGTLVVDLPAGVAQQGGDPPVSVATVLAGQRDHVRDQAVLVVTAARDAALGRAMLPQHPASAALRDPEPVADVIDALTATRGA